MSDRYNSLNQNHKLIWNFRDIGHTMRRISEGKGSQKRVLIVLYETGEITQKDLTQWLGIQPGSASEVIAKLESAGLITRTPSGTDRRTADIRLTDAGKEQAKAAREQREQRHDRMFSCLSTEEKDTLLSLLERINADWEQKFEESEVHFRNANLRKGRGQNFRK